jgi:pyruvate, water dikinase
MSRVPLADAADASRFGGKAARLSEAIRAGLRVPDGVALDADEVGGLVGGDPATRDAVIALVDGLGAPVAARSSAIGEDGIVHSFAGQHETVLNVTTGSALVEAITRVHASAHSPGALAYRRQHGIAGEPRIGVLVQRLVAADCAGVMFSVNPLTGADEIVVEASWGLGEGVVAGLVTPDRYRMARDGKVRERAAGDKDIAVVPRDGGGTEESAIAGERARRLCLADGQLAALVALAGACERAFGPRLDLEWAFAGEALFLLQWRPVTSQATRLQ